MPRLTLKLCESAKPAGKEYTLWDTVIQGLGLRVNPGGSRTWIFKYRHYGRQRKVSLGRFPDRSLHQAREDAARQRAGLASGYEHRLSVRHDFTFSELAERYLDEYAKLRKKTWMEDRRRLEKYLIPALGRRPAVAVTRTDVEALHRHIGKTAPYEANRVINLVSKIFTVAERWGLMPSDWHHPALRIEKFKEQKRSRWIRPEEMPALLQAVAAEPSLYIRAGVILYLLTGLRNRELMRVKWTDLDVDRGILVVAENKAGRPFWVQLPTMAIRIFDTIPRVPGSPWVFPGPDPRRPLSEFPRKAWYRIRNRAGLPDVRIHDLRRTFGSWLTTHGQALPIVARALNQSSLHTTQTYAHLVDDPIRRAVEDHARRLDPVVLPLWPELGKIGNNGNGENK